MSPCRKARVIAIDGPAGSGKTTVGSELARRLGYLFFDTGVVYRALTLAVLRLGISLADVEAIARVASELNIRVEQPNQSDGRPYTVFLDGEDVTWQLRSQEVDRAVSPVSAIQAARAALLGVQRQVVAKGKVVVVGRDVTTVVAPEADAKVFLDASPEERARRRYAEAAARGEAVTYEDVLSNVLERDRIDSGRETAPLRRAPDAIYIDSTRLSVHEVVEQLMRVICCDGQSLG